MEELLLDILRALRADPGLDARGLSRIVNGHSTRLPGDTRFAKKQIAPFYLRVKAEEPERWRGWGIDDATERRLLALVQMKPRRTASGVATITVITKPGPCSGSCLFCPCDVRMPKSYLHAEPACQRAERNWFDPYLQVASRLRALVQMGHPTDKVELIVLGGTWDDYPEAYQRWFARELFRALNDGVEDEADAGCGSGRGTGCGTGRDATPAIGGDDSADDTPARRRERYRRAGIANDDAELSAQADDIQARVTAGQMPFNLAIAQRYGTGAWAQVATWQAATWEELEAQQQANETAAHRCVGLVAETRPDLATPASLARMRRMGCTKVQVGVQSLDETVLEANGRGITGAQVARTFELLRLFGFKVHSHFMANLPGATPEGDKRDYRRFVEDAAFRPDEVKLYPCALIGSAPLARCLAQTGWQPYDEETLVDVLAADVLATPAFTRISRMIRDFSAGDIVAGNKKTNLRQLVEARLAADGGHVREIRYREIGTGDVDAAQLRMEDVAYGTRGTDEHFLQWVDADGRIAGFLRLSLPHRAALAAWEDAGTPPPVHPGEAMIREVHVYGRVARLHDVGTGAQHLGLGRQLVQRAAAIARAAGYSKLNVISAVGTREYYRKLGFADNGLYQQLPLDPESPLPPTEAPAL